ncbi:MAG: VOC family protein [Bacteroidota bacterium]|nr:VOC family protein [Bacteroidota bacterium]MDX5429871.1 VOC family protein [Bacteroidota bacterium]MDX5468649.1 VOC family protein [Bacteroidota bacterium]
MSEVITGIQQVGIGCSDVYANWAWYRKVFGMDVPVFDDAAPAPLMTRYTGGEVHTRQAVLALNMNGGGGFEIWSFKSRTPNGPDFQPAFGDLGINAVKMKARNVRYVHEQLKANNTEGLSELQKDPAGNDTFWVVDPWGNPFQVVKGDSWFSNRTQMTGGVSGVIIGVSDIDRTLDLYTKGLGFDTIVYDQSGQFDDLGKNKFRRVLLRKPQKNIGAFSKLIGHVEVELIQVLDREPKNIFAGRYWGDLGYIHVCFDTIDMDELAHRLKPLGYLFTVDSANSFDMGEAAGRFSYIEDPDGTWIEFVQTHRVPVLKKLGWYINLKDKAEPKPLPNWMIKAMGLNRVKG